MSQLLHHICVVRQSGGCWREQVVVPELWWLVVRESRQRQPARIHFPLHLCRFCAKSFRQTAPSDFERAVSPSFHTAAKIAGDATIGTRVHVGFVPLWNTCFFSSSTSTRVNTLCAAEMESKTVPLFCARSCHKFRSSCEVF